MNTLFDAVSAIFIQESQLLHPADFNLESWERIHEKLLILDFPQYQKTNFRQFNAYSYTEMYNNSWVGAYVELNENYKNLEVDNLSVLEIECFYPNVIISLGSAKEPSKSINILAYLVSLRHVFRDMSLSCYQMVKCYINFFYGIKCKPHLVSNTIPSAEEVTIAARTFLEKFAHIFRNNMIYADTDIVIVKGEIPSKAIDFISEFGMICEISTYESGIFFAKKKYFLFKKRENVVIRGFRHY
jgi:hypothetical protein